MTIRDNKANLDVPYTAWYIFSEDEHPMCWGDETFGNPCLEFHTEESAIRFRDAVLAIPFLTDVFATAQVKHCIFYYDDGKLDATNLIPVANGDDIELQEVGVDD